MVAGHAGYHNAAAAVILVNIGDQPPLAGAGNVHLIDYGHGPGEVLVDAKEGLGGDPNQA